MLQPTYSKLILPHENSLHVYSPCGRILRRDFSIEIFSGRKLSVVFLPIGKESTVFRCLILLVYVAYCTPVHRPRLATIICVDIWKCVLTETRMASVFVSKFYHWYNSNFNISVFFNNPTRPLLQQKKRIYSQFEHLKSVDVTLDSVSSCWSPMGNIFVHQSVTKIFIRNDVTKYSD